MNIRANGTWKYVTGIAGALVALTSVFVALDARGRDLITASVAQHARLPHHEHAPDMVAHHERSALSRAHEDAVSKDQLKAIIKPLQMELRAIRQLLERQDRHRQLLQRRRGEP